MTQSRGTSGADIIGFGAQTLDTIADALSQTGYIILPDAVSNSLAKGLKKHAQNLTPDDWKRAGIGRGAEFQMDQRIRSDSIRWITASNPVQTTFLAWMESLRRGLNQRLFLGLFDFESHFSWYPEGASYAKHSDALKGRSNRILSCVLYLNTHWKKADAGALLLYPETGDQPIQTIIPTFGTLVLFLSEKFPHEVMKANRPRYSIAGWFRVNASAVQKN